MWVHSIFKGRLWEYLWGCLCGEILELYKPYESIGYICPRLLSRRIRPPKLIANCKWIPVSASRCTTGIVTGFPSGESPGVQWDSKNNIKVEEVNLQYVLPPFSALVSWQRDTAVWLGDKKRIIVVRRWRNNIGPAQPIWVEDNYCLIVYTNLFRTFSHKKYA